MKMTRFLSLGLLIAVCIAALFLPVTTNGQAAWVAVQPQATREVWVVNDREAAAQALPVQPQRAEGCVIDAPTGSITGTVTTSDGQPISGLSVRVVRADGQSTGSSSSAGIMGNTATFRVYDLLPGNYFLYVADGYYGDAKTMEYAGAWYPGVASRSAAVAVAVVSGQTTPNINLVLQKDGGWITGVLTSAVTSNPIASAYVGAWFYDDSDTQLPFYAATDASGRYRSPRLPAGKYKVQFAPPDYIDQFYNSASNLASATQVQVTASMTTTNINAVLQPKGQIKGRVVAADTLLPILNAGVRVSASSLFVYATTDTSGYYTASVPPGNYTVYAGASNYSIQLFDGVLLPAQATTVTMTGSTDVTGIDFALTKGGNASGRLMDDSTGQGLDFSVNARLSLLDTSGQRVSFLYGWSRNLNGDFSFEGFPPGTYKLRVEAPGYIDSYYNGKPDAASADAFVVGEGSTTNLGAIRLRPCTSLVTATPSPSTPAPTSAPTATPVPTRVVMLPIIRR